MRMDHAIRLGKASPMTDPDRPGVGLTKIEGLDGGAVYALIVADRSAEQAASDRAQLIALNTTIVNNQALIIENQQAIIAGNGRREALLSEMVNLLGKPSGL